MTEPPNQFNTPGGYIERPQPAFPQARGPFSTWWQVKDSNLRSFRDGFTDHRSHARDQQQCLSPDKLPGVFPTGSRRQPTTTVASRTPPRPQEHLSRPALDRVLAARATV